MLSPPNVLLSAPTPTSAVGVFGIATRMVQRGKKGRPSRQRAASRARPRPWSTGPSGTPPPSQAARGAGRARSRLAHGRRRARPRSTSASRARTRAGLRRTLSDPNVSRRHAELRQEETSFWIVDLGSTNGMEVNGARLRAGQARSAATGSCSGRPSVVFDARASDDASAASIAVERGPARCSRSASSCCSTSSSGASSAPRAATCAAPPGEHDPRPQRPREQKQQPADASAAAPPAGRLVVVTSPALSHRRRAALDSGPLHRSAARGQRPSARARRVLLGTSRPRRTAPRRRLGPRRRLDERHLRERRPV